MEDLEMLHIRGELPIDEDGDQVPTPSEPELDVVVDLSLASVHGGLSACCIFEESLS
jgi:hypothetical protein